MNPSTEHWLLSTISKRLERIAEGKETMAEDRALTLLSILKDVAGDIPSLTSLPQHVKEWLEAAINARLDAIADKREIAAEDRIATLTEALAALRPPAAPGGSVERVDTGAGLSGGPITTTGTISLSTSSQQAIAKANTAVQPENLADVATSGNYADLTNTPTIPEQFNPIQGANMLITGTYPNITFSAVAGEEFTPVWGEIQGTLSDQTDLQAALDGKAPAVHQHNASDINAGTLANARISQGSVTQHQAALSIGWSQLSGLPAFATRWPTWNEVTGKPSIPQGTVTSVSAGNGMSFSTITGSGAVTLGTPGTITLSSTNNVTASSHTHNFAPGGTTAQYIRGDGTLVTFPSIPSGNTINVEDIRTTDPAPTAYPDEAVSAHFNSAWVGVGSSWRSALTVRGWNGNYTTWQLVGPAGISPDDDFYLRSGVGSWRTPVLIYHSGNFDPSTKANATTSVSAGNGLSGGGTLAANRTITLATPGTLSGSTANAVQANSHTHALSANLSAWDALATSDKADVNQPTLNGSVTIYSSSIAGRQIQFADNNGPTGAVVRGSGSSLVLTPAGGSIIIRPVGPGDTTNQSSFGQNGDLAVAGSISAGGNMSVSGTVTATNLTATSDPRLKTNKQKTKARRELIEKLEYWSFEWKKDGTKGRSVMADKVLEIAPEHVHIGDDEDKTLAVDKGALALEMVFALIDMLKETDEETVHDVD